MIDGRGPSARLTADLENAGMVDAKYQVTGIGPTLTGRNGGGDLYYTDGEIWVLRLVEACRKRDGPAVTIRRSARRSQFAGAAASVIAGPP